MAWSQCKQPKLPESAEEMEAFFAKMEKKDEQPVNLAAYFSKEELADMCDIERLRLTNMKRNYDMMRELGQLSWG